VPGWIHGKQVEALAFRTDLGVCARSTGADVPAWAVMSRDAESSSGMTNKFLACMGRPRSMMGRLHDYSAGCLRSRHPPLVTMGLWFRQGLTNIQLNG
jgi:hypothetical protein